MIFIILSLASSTVIAVLFKIFEKRKIPLFQVVVLNYLSATLCGFLLNDTPFVLKDLFAKDWILLCVIIGFLLILMFYLIGYSTQKAGITITTISNKMSVILPILFSIYFYHEKLTVLKLAGCITAILALLFSVYKKNSKASSSKNLYLPFLLFFGMGLIDSLIKFSQQDFIKPNETAIFTAFSFAVAGLTGIILSLINYKSLQKFLNIKTVISGLFLGLVNFGSMYFLIIALNNSGLDSSIVYAVNNTGIIFLSVIIAMLLFKEKLSVINWIGLALTIVSVIILTGLSSL